MLVDSIFRDNHQRGNGHHGRLGDRRFGGNVDSHRRIWHSNRDYHGYRNVIERHEHYARAKWDYEL